LKWPKDVFYWLKTFKMDNEIKKLDYAKPTGEEEPVACGDPSFRKVAERAYFYYENGGRLDGHDLEHWFRAEQELISNQPRTRIHGSHN
jgi:hypothetical protein